MSELMKTKKEILEPFLWDDPEGGRNVCEFDAIEAMERYARQFYPPAFVEWKFSYASMISVRDGVHGMWYGYGSRYFTLAELYEYWQKNVEDKK